MQTRGSGSWVEALEPRLLFSSSAIPRPDHVVVLLEEDHSYSEILGDVAPVPQVWAVSPPPFVGNAPSLRELAKNGASFTNAFSVGNHNSVDYQAIFSGLIPTRGTPAPYSTPNLATELEAAGLSFGGYSEGLPRMGYNGDGPGDYTRAHNPWVDFSNVRASDNLPFARFPGDYSRLPTVSYVVPDEQHNMHSGTVLDGDMWFQGNIARYANWAMSHNSLLIVTWDESHQSNDQIPTLFFGPMVKRGLYSEHMTQANILRTIEDMYGLAPTGRSAQANPITDIFQTKTRIARQPVGRTHRPPTRAAHRAAKPHVTDA